MTGQIKDGLLSEYLRQARFRQVIPHVRGKKILDIGCDEGFIVPYLPNGVEYFGIEPDEKALAKARKKYPQHRFDQVHIGKGSVCQASSSKYDTILLIAVLEHMEEPIAVLEYLAELLNPKGRVVITSPSQKSHGLLVVLSKLRLARNDKDEHKFYINNKMISKLVAAGRYKRVLHKKFQLRLNQLWVLEKGEQQNDG